MNKLKNIAIAFLSGLAVALATAVFILWKVANHRAELARARTFLSEVPRSERESVLEAFEAKRDTFEETALALRDEVEKETKREITDAFKKAFNVRPDVDVDDLTHIDRRDTNKQ